MPSESSEITLKYDSDEQEDEVTEGVVVNEDGEEGFFVKNHKILNEEIINDALNDLFSKGITKEEILKELMKEDNKND